MFPQDHELFALDSTTILSSITLMIWALGKYSKGAVKMHALIDLRGSITDFVSIGDGRRHDRKFLDEIDVIPNVIYTMDKAYVAFKSLARIDADGLTSSCGLRPT